MEVSNWLTIIGLLGAYVGAGWGVYSAVCKKIESNAKSETEKFKVYESLVNQRFETLLRRLDDNKAESYKNFLLKEVHDEAKKSQKELYEEGKKHQIEITDQKFLSLIKLFETHLNHLTTEVKRLNDKIYGVNGND